MACDFRPTVTFPVAERHCPLTITAPNYTAWLQGQNGTSNLSRVVTHTARVLASQAEAIVDR